MNTQLLETFIDLLETRNFNRTADRLDVTQSTVSARIRQLEAGLGTRLFERGRGGAEPTAAGLRFETRCRSLLALWENARQDARLDRRYSRSLRISSQYSLIRFFLLDWAESLRRQQPGIVLHLEVDYSTQILRDLVSGTADIGIIFAPNYFPDLFIRQIAEEDFVLVSTTETTLQAIDPETYIRVTYTPFFDRNHDELLPDFRQVPLSVGCDDLAVELLKRSGGSTYLPRFLVEDLGGDIPGLDVVGDAPVIPQPVYSAVHVRQRHERLIVDALKSLDHLIAERGQY